VVESSSRARFVCLATLLISGGIALLALGQPWVVRTVSESGLPAVTISQLGRELAPVAGASVWVVLAGVLGVIATRGWGRVAIGLAVCGSGLLTAVGAASAGADLAGAASAGLGSDAVVQVAIAAIPWWWIAAVCGGIAAASGAYVAVRVPSWPGLSRRYDRTDAGVAPSRQLGSSEPAPVAPTAREQWDALDRGTDPTDSAIANATPQLEPTDPSDRLDQSGSTNP